MKPLPKHYRWLGDEPGPNMLMNALLFYGTIEFAGKANNPIIMAMAAETGYDKVYKHDSIPWCGLGQAVCAKRAGWDFHPGGNALWALNWAKWGNAVPEKNRAMLGDIGVWKREGGGHVGQIIGYDDEGYYHVLGFNQTDQCNIVRKPINGIFAVRRAAWRMAQPQNVRRIKLAAGGAAISTKES